MPSDRFAANPEFSELLGDYSGNSVNGLGEEEVRRPEMVWWAPDMDAVVFGAAQKWFYQHEQPDEEMRELRARRLAAVQSELPPVAEQQDRLVRRRMDGVVEVSSSTPATAK